MTAVSLCWLRSAMAFRVHSPPSPVRGPRRSVTTLLVADIDNDGSAEIVVTSNTHDGINPTVRVIKDYQDR